MLYVGIDPGVTGAIAVLDDSDGEMWIYSLSEVDIGRTIGATFLDITYDERPNREVLVVIEKPQIMVKNVSLTAKQFQQFGEILGALSALKIPHETVTPQKWQKAVLPTLPKGRDKVKKATREWAIARWPKTDWKRTERSRTIWQDACDAAAMAAYAKLRAGE